jgi:hypothetical protein
MMLTMAVTIVLLALVAGYNRYRIHKLDRTINLMTDNSVLQTILLDRLMVDWCKRNGKEVPPGHDRIMTKIMEIMDVPQTG